MPTEKKKGKHEVINVHADPEEAPPATAEPQESKKKKSKETAPSPESVEKEAGIIERAGKRNEDVFREKFFPKGTKTLSSDSVFDLNRECWTNKASGQTFNTTMKYDEAYALFIKRLDAVDRSHNKSQKEGHRSFKTRESVIKNVLGIQMIPKKAPEAQAEPTPQKQKEDKKELELEEEIEEAEEENIEMNKLNEQIEQLKAENKKISEEKQATTD